MSATEVKHRRGLKSAGETFTGGEGEITMDTDTGRIRVHDQSTPGGFLVPKAHDLQTGAFNYDDAPTGTADDIIVATEIDPPALIAGLFVRFKAALPNTGAVTLQWGSLSPASCKKYVGGSKVDLQQDEIQAGAIYEFDFDGIDWVQGASAGGGLIGYQVFTATGPWTKPANCNAVRVTVIGGGGGGGIVGGTTNGGTSSFGTYCSATGGLAGTSGGTGGDGVGGDLNIKGGDGFGQSPSDEGIGGSSYIGAGGRGATAALDNTGGGGGSIANQIPGGAGGTAIKFIESPESTISVTVGAGGNSFNAGNGGSGIVIVEGYS